jgi:hypothetical protein
MKDNDKLTEIMLATIIGTMAYQAIEDTMSYKPSLLERIREYLSIFPFNNLNIIVDNISHHMI